MDDAWLDSRISLASDRPFTSNACSMGGVWQHENAKITVQSQADGQLDIRGHAVRDLGLGTGEIVGDFEVTGRPLHGVLSGDGDDSGCEVAVRLLGDYLVVGDNGACGGVGVSFNGMYRLRHH